MVCICYNKKQTMWSILFHGDKTMKREEKNLQSRQKIMDAAIQEFGEKSYGEASLNTICDTGNLSKGIIYHYFTDKDELYLACVKECFDKLTSFLNRDDYDFTDFQRGINNYLAARYQFFRQYPHYSHLFFSTFLQPPTHLIKQIQELRKDFDAQSTRYYETALSHITLRENITNEEAMEYFFIFQEMFNGYFQSKAYENTDFNSLIKDHEMKLSKLLNMMLYGIAKEDSEL